MMLNNYSAPMKDMLTHLQYLSQWQNCSSLQVSTKYLPDNVLEINDKDIVMPYRLVDFPSNNGKYTQLFFRLNCFVDVIGLTFVIT